MNAMPRSPHATTSRPSAIALRHLSVVALVVLLAMQVSTTAARADVGLGTADSFAVLAGQSVTNTGSTTITGDIGVHPGAAADNVTGSGSITLTGTIHDGDGVAQQAKADLVDAYDDAAGRTPITILPELAGEDLGPGVYESTGGGAFQVGGGGTLTLTGDADDVWIFQSGSALDFTSGSTVELNGADPCNVFWQVTSSATLGTNSTVVGTIMALTSISLLTGAELEGRALARNGSVTMDSNTITNEDCSTPADDTTTIDLDATAPSNGGGGGSSSSSDDSDEADEAAAAEEDDEATPPVPVQPPTRVDAGAGGTAPPTGQPGVLLLLAVAVVGTAVTLRRRTANIR